MGSSWKSCNTLVSGEFGPVADFSISAWFRTDNRGPCFSARRPMGDELLLDDFSIMII